MRHVRAATPCGTCEQQRHTARASSNAIRHTRAATPCGTREQQRRGMRHARTATTGRCGTKGQQRHAARENCNNREMRHERAATPRHARTATTGRCGTKGQQRRGTRELQQPGDAARKGSNAAARDANAQRHAAGCVMLCCRTGRQAGPARRAGPPFARPPRTCAPPPKQQARLGRASPPASPIATRTRVAARLPHSDSDARRRPPPP